MTTRVPELSEGQPRRVRPERPSKTVQFPASELPVGSRKIVDLGGVEVGVFHTEAGLYAVRNICPHQLAPLCQGMVGGTMVPADVGEYEWGLDGQIVRCPWHAYEFDMETGKALADSDGTGMRAKVYPVRQEGDQITIYLVGRPAPQED